MANKLDNLIPGGHKLTLEEQKMGGVASGEARRKKATMKATLEKMLEVTQEKGKYKGMSYRELSTLGLINSAIKGNAQSYRLILETLGELKSNVDNNDINNQILNIANLLNNPKDNRSDKDVQ